MGHRRDLERLRPELEAWVACCGAADLGTSAVSITEIP
jgi:hypothetical protein